MIAKGNTHASGGKLADYLVNGKEGERAELWKVRGFDGLSLKDGFRVVEAMAAATRCEKPFFHCQVRNPEGEELTRAQWEQVADRLESRVGLSNQPRVMAFHIDEETGHEHLHLAWSRIDEESMRAKALPFFKLRLKEACRELELEMGLTQVRNERGRDEPPAPMRDELEEARRLGIDVKAVRQAIRDCWNASDSGHAFAAALAEHELSLAQGDRRDYVVVDPEGGLHALGKRLLGCSMAETRERLSDLDRTTLPNIDEARYGLGENAGQRYILAAPELPTPAFGPDHEPQHDTGRADPAARDPHSIGGPPEAPILGAAIGGVASIAAEAAAGAAEKTLDTIADMFSFGAAGSAPPKRAPNEVTSPVAREGTTLKPEDEPRAIDAQRLRTAQRDTAASDPATRAAFENNPAAASPDVAQQILNQWRKQREKDRDLER